MRLRKELANAQKMADSTAARLANPGFVNNAPDNVIAGARQQLAEWQAKRRHRSKNGWRPWKLAFDQRGCAFVAKTGRHRAARFLLSHGQDVELLSLRATVSSVSTAHDVACCWLLAEHHCDFSRVPGNGVCGRAHQISANLFRADQCTFCPASAP